MRYCTLLPTRVFVGLLLSLVFAMSLPVSAHATVGCVGGAVGGAAASTVTSVAKAAVPVNDGLGNTLKSQGNAVECEESFVEQVLKGIAWAAAKAVVNSITQSLVNWINSGFNGSPAFETDLNQSLVELQDEVTNAFLADLFTDVGKGDMINSEFAERIGQGIATSYYIYTSGERLAYRLRSNIQNYSQNPDLFRRGDFSQGGWQAWHQSNVVCGNNVYCFQFAARDEHAVRLMQEVDQYVTELGWGDGFLSWKGDCIRARRADGTEATATVDQRSGNTQGVNLGAGDKCLNHNIKTPGSVTEDYLAFQLGSGVRQLELADSINEIVGALVGQLVQQVFGPGGLLGTSDSPSGGGRSLVTQIGDSSQGSGGETQLVANIDSKISDITAFLTGWQVLQGAALATQATLASCNDDVAEAALTATVEPTLARAEANIRRAEIALAELNRIKGTLTATPTPNTNQTALLATASADLLALTSGSNMPSDAEVGEARSESSSNPNLGDSLFLQLQALAAEGCS